MPKKQLHLQGASCSPRGPFTPLCPETLGPSFIRTMDVIQKIEQEQLKEDVTDFNVGDTVKVHTLVREGSKERVQIFAGLVIARRGSSVNEAFTVRKISYGEGVERVFQLHSPRVSKIEVTHRGKVRRAKLHYLRGRVGKRALQVKSRDQQ